MTAQQFGDIQTKDMTPVDFQEVNCRIAENQEEFITLPAHVNQSKGTITFGFELTPEEKAQIAETGIIWVQILSKGYMPPIYLTTNKEELI